MHCAGAADAGWRSLEDEAMDRIIRAPSGLTRQPGRLILALLGILFLLAACSPVAAPSGKAFGLSEPAMRVLLAIVGGLLLTIGYILYQIILQIIGLIAGGLLGAIVANYLAEGESIYLVAGFIIGAVIGTMLAESMTYLAVFLGGFFLGIIAAESAFRTLAGNEPGTLVLGVGGIIGGLVVVGLYQVWVTALMSAVGAVLFGVAISAPVILWFVFFIAGMGIQLGAAYATGHEERIRPGYHGEREEP